MQWLDSAWSKHLIQNLNFLHELHRDVLEASWQLSHISQHNFQVIPQALVLVRLKSFDDRLENDWVLLLVQLIDYLLFAFEVY